MRRERDPPLGDAQVARVQAVLVLRLPEIRGNVLDRRFFLPPSPLDNSGAVWFVFEAAGPAARGLGKLLAELVALVGDCEWLA